MNFSSFASLSTNLAVKRTGGKSGWYPAHFFWPRVAEAFAYSLPASSLDPSRSAAAPSRKKSQSSGMECGLRTYWNDMAPCLQSSTKFGMRCSKCADLYSDNLWSLLGSLDLKFLVSLSFTDLIVLEHPFPWFQAKRWEEFLRRQSMRYNAGVRWEERFWGESIWAARRGFHKWVISKLYGLYWKIPRKNIFSHKTIAHTLSSRW